MAIVLPPAYVLPDPPDSVFQHPVGLYSIAYDVQVHPTEDPLPHGWFAPRARTYRRLINYLMRRGFQRRQYSLYTCAPHGSTGEQAWDIMLTMMHIYPYGKMATTVGGLALFYSADEGWDVTGEVALGGPFSTQLYGPVPRSLVPAAIQGINGPPQVPPPNVRLPPIDTINDPEGRSRNRNNYLT